MLKPVVLVIMDGFGNNPEKEGNAVYTAKTPNLDKIFSQNPLTYIGASGMDVGLPDGQMGNSEVGHTNMGAGRVVYQELTRITKSIKDGDFFENAEFLKAVKNCKDNGSALHLMGLLSDGGVHSHYDHLLGLLNLAKQNGLTKVYVHGLLDGRDVPPASAADYVKSLEADMQKIGVGKIATVMGRYYGMDRDNRWDRVQKAYDALVYGKGIQTDNAENAIRGSYTVKDQEGKFLTDEFVLPPVVGGTERVKSGDSLIFFNFRPDRAREITRAFCDNDFSGFDRGEKLDLCYICMTQYDATIQNVSVAFKPQELKNTLGEILAKNGLTQLRIAETEKYAHVTFFFNGGREVEFDGEDRILVKSPKVATYDLQPEMSAPEVCEKVVDAIKSDKYNVVILNFANCDMVGHTGVFDAAVKAVETVDNCVRKVVDATTEMGGAVLITADHGNADKMVDTDGSPFTAHTTFPVPFCVVNYPCELKTGCKLCDISPTILKLLGVAQPEEMNGESIIK
ncbi:MAG: 2,3-bisphosphoglycerate-independent phosphoglycerate mutase [Oscillospiraceae bacterium]|nr:2,3-bisphosphoglycerate-independent phosphoglycerate mutase [Candidatus Equicaccousia limihippi]